MEKTAIWNTTQRVVNGSNKHMNMNMNSMLSYNCVMMSNDVLQRLYHLGLRHKSMESLYILLTSIDVSSSNAITTRSTNRLTAIAAIVLPCALLASIFHVDVFIPAQTDVS